MIEWIERTCISNRHNNNVEINLQGLLKIDSTESTSIFSTHGTIVC